MCTKADIQTQIGQLTSKMTKMENNNQCSIRRDFNNNIYKVAHLKCYIGLRYTWNFKPYPEIFKRNKGASLGKVKTNLRPRFSRYKRLLEGRYERQNRVLETL